MGKELGADYWQDVLSGRNARLMRTDRLLRRLPAPPRCRVCGAPFKGPYAPFLKVAGFRRWNLNRQICTHCADKMKRARGGADVPASVLFADVRGSTTLAETIDPAEFKRLMDGLHRLAYAVVDGHRGVIDNIAGDGFMAFWIPVFTEDHAGYTVRAGEALVDEVSREFGDELPLGAAVHSGVAHVGIVGHDESLDLTILGDVPNTVARLNSAAGPGELVLSDAIVGEASVSTAGLRRTSLDLRGKAEPVDAWVRPATTATGPI